MTDVIPVVYLFSPVELLTLSLIQLRDDVGESAIDPGNNHCRVKMIKSTITSVH